LTFEPDLARSVKDARSVSLHPYRLSQHLQNVEHTKLIKSAKGIAKMLCKNVFGLARKQKQQQKGKHNNPCQSWEWNPGPISPQSGALPAEE